MRDADQRSGADLNPQMRLPGQAGPSSSGGGGATANPTRDRSEAEKRKRLAAADDEPHRPVKRLTSPEKFEAQQLIASGVLDVRDYPQFDDEAGLMNVEKTEEELEIELNEQEPLFLRGQTKNSVAMSPIPSCSSSRTAVHAKGSKRPACPWWPARASGTASRQTCNSNCRCYRKG